MSDAYSEHPDQQGLTKGGEEVELWLVDDEEEEIHAYSTSIDFYGMTFSFKFPTPEAAKAFYNAAIECIEIEEL